MFTVAYGSSRRETEEANRRSTRIVSSDARQTDLACHWAVKDASDACTGHPTLASCTDPRRANWAIDPIAAFDLLGTIQQISSEHRLATLIAPPSGRN